VRDGKILYPALSNYAAWQTQRAIDLQELRGFAKVACIQPMYNLLKRQVEVELLPMAQENEIGVFPYSPLAAGILTGKYADTQVRVDAGRMLTSKNYQKRYEQSDSQTAAAGLLQIAQRIGVTATALAVAWVAAHPGVTAPLLGARNVAQLEGALAAADLTISPELYAEISALTPAPASATDRADDGTEVDLWRR